MKPENEMKPGNGMENENIQKAFIDYWIRHGYECDVFTGDNIPAQQIVAHRQSYAPVTENERILLLVGDIRSSFDIGLCITDRFVYYKLMPDTFFAPFQQKMKGIVPIKTPRRTSVCSRPICAQTRETNAGLSFAACCLSYLSRSLQSS